MRKFAIAAALILVAGLTATCSPAQATVTHVEYLKVGGTQPNGGGVGTPYGRWASTTIKVQDATDGGWRIAEAAAEWNAVRVVNLVVSRDACTGCIQVFENPDLPYGYGGLARITTSGGIITHVRVELQPAYQYPHPVADTIESHEVGGHGTGLPHINDPRAVMNPVASLSSPGEPAPPDRRVLRSLYR